MRLSREGEGATLAEKGSRKPAALELHAVFIDSLFPFERRPSEKFATIEGEIELTGTPARPVFFAAKSGAETRPINYEDPPTPEVRDPTRSTPRRKSVELEFEAANFQNMGSAGGPLGHLILPEFPAKSRYLEIDTVLLIDGGEEAPLEHSDLFDILIHRSSGDPVPPTTFGMRLVAARRLPGPVPFKVTDPDGSTHQGELNENGECFVDDLTPGNCLVELPSLAAHDWGSVPREGPSSPHAATGEEDLPKIACSEGFQDWRTIFDHPDNEALREERPNPNQLAKGDSIAIPTKDAEPVSARTGELHSFKLLSEPIERLVLRIDSEVGFRYKLEVGGQIFRGTRAAGASIDHIVPREPASAILSLVHDGDPEEDEFVFELKLGALEPVVTNRGVQARLTNLGFDTEGVDGAMGPKSGAALKAFQRFAGLEITGEVDEATRRELKKRHDEPLPLDENDRSTTGVGPEFDPETGAVL